MIKRVSAIKLRCPFCETESYYEEDNICPVCSTEMQQRTECQCCGEYSIPENECEDYCNECKSRVHKKMYEFLSELSEEEIALLDDTIDDGLEFFMQDYKEK